MNELEQALIGDSAAAPPAHILEGIQSDLAHRVVQGAPHTIYQELWHIAFWQQLTLEWVNGIETPFPAQPSDGFPADDREPWDQLCSIVEVATEGTQKVGDLFWHDLFL